ncbi:MAG: hypothetical protein QM811_24175 [Pirellulales bacterium]
METPLLSLTIDAEDRSYFPGETLQGEYQIDAVDADDLRTIELSVLWRTEGKGDEDFGVHYFLRRERTDEGAPALWRSFSTLLPETPLSYDGVIVKIHWLARLRVYMRSGQDFVEERPFRLGDLPPAAPPETPAEKPVVAPPRGGAKANDAAKT